MKLLRYVILSFVLVLCVCVAVGQNKQNEDTLMLKDRLSKAIGFLQKKEPEKAIALAGKMAMEVADAKYRMEFFDVVAQAYSQIDEFPSALTYRFRMLDVAQKLNDSAYISLANRKIGDLYSTSDLFDKAAEYYAAGVSYYPDTVNTAAFISLLELVAYSYFRTEFYPEAVSYYRELERIYKQKKQMKAYFNTLHMIAYTYQLMPDYEAALQVNLKLYEEIRGYGDAEALADCMSNLAYSYLKLGQPEQALKYFRSILYFDNSGSEDLEDEAKTLTNIGICQQHLGNYEKAMESLKQALKIYTDNPDIEGHGKLHNLIAKVYLQEGDTYNAEMHVIEAIGEGKRTYNISDLQNAYQTYSELLQANANFEGALDYYKLYLNLKDSVLRIDMLKEQQRGQLRRGLEQSESNIKLIIADENLKDLALRKLKLEADKKEQDLALLQRERELQNATLQQQRQALALAKQQNEAQVQQQQIRDLEQQQALQAAKLKQAQMEEAERKREIELLEREKRISNLQIERQKQEEEGMRRMFGFLGIIIVLILIGFFVSYRTNRKLETQKKEIQQRNVDLAQKSEEVISQNEEITRQKELIGKKNQDITNSLIYAKRIQQAAIPSIALLEEHFDDFFVFFSPREIVSGDFYWVGKQDNDVIFAAADCTGHGVPGAFMSMLGISFLNEIVLSRKIHQANEILESLRRLVKRSLKQEGNVKRAKDGMDIALCIIDLDTNEMQFAGANNPVLIIRGGELIQIKGDRNPIGVFVKEKPFTNKTVQLQKGDTIYLFSDGYLDQFGGERGEKFMTKRFKQFLLEIYELPMKLQRAKLRERLAQWQGNDFPQIDDVLVMGVRV